MGKKLGKQRMELFGRHVGARVLIFGVVVFLILDLLYILGIENDLSIDFRILIVLLVMC
ncbi:MAG: hypothetical protein QW597_03555 [Thermoplasmataceae archaeon]